ncbi:MAG: ubiquinol-cytochrome c reductase iron-sulfur subunit [Chromatiales bacterium]|jgi:ubiquinol-cytochrome c reductase iron-sulfur subunit|nr:ubiquinol-cytochrome c reductase iron-sulfur subunit [Chromatiales bacterium]MDH4029320.1 ubiquinol-cytochrome c reductase iron-sulfur subunit [Chromatiales bacterium]
MSEDVDLSRRHFLGVATAVTGGVGAVFAATPFLASWQPSARAQALGAPVEVDIGKLEPGALLKVEWRGKPVWILRRTDVMLERVRETDAEVRDPASEQPQQPEYARNEYRAIKPEILIVVGSCTHLGCSPIERFDLAPADLGPDWRGGFYCPCHGSKFDLSGRVYKGVPAPLNLPVPPHRYLSDSVILIGSDTGVA